MARIPTYDRQQTQVTPKQYFNTENPVGVAVKGVAQGLGAAGGVIESVQDYQKVKEQEQDSLYKADLEADTAKIYNADNNTLNDLGVAQVKIQNQFKDAPDLQKMNDALRDEYSQITQKYIQDLTPAGAEHYMKLANAELQNRMRQNETFYKTRSAALLKARESQLANTIDDNIDRDVVRAGLIGEPYSNVGVNLKEGGRYELSPDEVLLPDNVRKKAASIANKYYLAALDRPVVDQYDENGDLTFPGIVS